MFLIKPKAFKEKYDRFCHRMHYRFWDVNELSLSDDEYIKIATEKLCAFYSSYPDRDILWYHLSELEREQDDMKSYAIGILSGAASGFIVYLFQEASKANISSWLKTLFEGISALLFQRDIVTAELASQVMVLAFGIACIAAIFIAVIFFMTILYPNVALNRSNKRTYIRENEILFLRQMLKN